MEAVAEATPLIATKCTCAMATFSLCSNIATGLGMIKNRPSLSLASFPGSPPPLYFIRAILFTRNYCAGRREGESLEGFDHVRTLMTRSVSIVSTYESPKERERSPDQRASRLFGVLYRWLDRRTRLPANFLTPRALESQRTIIIGSWQPTHRAEIQEHEASKGWRTVLSIDRAICRALQKAY